MKKFIICLLILGLSSSCVRMEDLSYKGIEEVAVQSIGSTQSTLNLMVRAANRSGTTLTLAQAEVTLYQGERPLVTATITQKVKLPRKFDGTILIPVKIRFEGGILGMLQTVSLLSQGAKGTSVSGRVVAKAGLGRKKYEFKEMGTERFLKQFGIDLSQIMKELKP